MASSTRFWFNLVIFLVVCMWLAACSSNDHLAEAPLCRGTAFAINATPAPAVASVSPEVK
jgi:hypothetical protein